MGFLVLYGSRRFMRISQAFWTAAPLRSEEAEAAVGLVLGTVLVLVSEMWIFEQGIPRTLLATWTILVWSPCPISVPPWVISTDPSV